MNLKVGFLALSIVGLGFSAKAMAQTPPSACQAGPDFDSFEAGVASGRSLARQGWAGVSGDCLQLERFASILVDNAGRLMAPPGSSSYVLCRHSGIVAGVYEEVFNAWSSCRVEACVAGNFIGQLGGKLACDIALGFGPVHILRFLPALPATAFPLLSERCCGNAFDSELQQCLPGSSWNPVREYVCTPPSP
ncbi:hypothetical protein [Polyangium aurulentum]|uniref:hypothetical protein n=1 Tax=Polyangium aurulentum TaxID=2567896 RepID=UPI0010AE38E3|nr:hypothetical protein [Polyangium aurulentum]UQA59534.1 hypothetical protein E8A73_003200 [Polyangium aurulentum]